MTKRYKQTLEAIKPYALLLVLVGVMGFIIFRPWGGDPSDQLLRGADKATQNQSSEVVENNPTKEKSQQGSSGGQASQTHCRNEDIPYKTVEKPGEWLYIGETQVYEGKVGKQKVCTDSRGKTTATVTLSPMDKVVYKGTKQRQSTAQPESPNYSYDEALARSKEACRRKGIQEGSTDMRDCTNNEMSRYGY